MVWKHCRQSTGRPCVGLNGTVVSMPQAEHSVRVSVRERPAAAGPLPAFMLAPDRFDLHGLQRFGSFLNCLSKKKSCSPAVKINSPPQSAHVKSRSRNSIPRLPLLPKGRTLCGPDRGDSAETSTFAVELYCLDLKGAQNANAWNASICQSKCEPVFRLSLLVPVNGGSPSLWLFRRPSLQTLQRGGDGLPWLQS